MGIAAILVYALVLRLAGIDKSLWIDECSSYVQATASDFIAQARNYDHPPLYFALLRVGTMVTDSFTALRLFSVLCALIPIALCLGWPGTQPRRPVWVAALWIMATPGFVSHGQELRQYALFAASLTGSLACVTRILDGSRSKAPLIGLAIGCALMASTHLIAAFFVASIGAVLLWRLRRTGPRSCLPVVAALLPALGLVVFFKEVFLQQAEKDAAWWMPAVTARLLCTTFSDISGWNAIQELAAGINRHFPGVGNVLTIAAPLGFGYILWTAFGHRPKGNGVALTAIALLYWLALVAYSLIAVPVVWPRILLPGMIPLLLGIGLGIESQPNPKQRRSAIGAAALLAVLMTVQWLNARAYFPHEDLRRFTASIRDLTDPDTHVILLNGGEIGIWPYWQELKPTAFAHLDPRTDDPSAKADAVLAGRRWSKLIVVFRKDSVYTARKEIVDRFIAELSKRAAGAHEVENTYSYRLFKFEYEALPRPAERAGRSRDGEF